MGHPFRKEETTLEDRMAKLNNPPIMQGELKNISLADILQLLGNRSGRHLVEISLPQGVGKIFLEGQNLHHAEIVGDEEKEGFEAFCTLLRLEEGRFEVRQPVIWPEKGNLKGPLQAFLIEAIRQMDEAASEETFFNEDLFEKALELNPPEIPEPEEPSYLEKIKQKLPEIKFFLLLGPTGEIKEAVGQGEAEELSGFVSYAIFQLREIGNLLGIGELKAFAISGKRKLSAGLVKGEEIMGFSGTSRRGLLWWSKKLLEVVEETK